MGVRVEDLLRNTDIWFNFWEMRRGDLFIYGKEGFGGKGSVVLEECY